MEEKGLNKFDLNMKMMTTLMRKNKVVIIPSGNETLFLNFNHNLTHNSTYEGCSLSNLTLTLSFTSNSNKKVKQGFVSYMFILESKCRAQFGLFPKKENGLSTIKNFMTPLEYCNSFTLTINFFHLKSNGSKKSA